MHSSDGSRSEDSDVEGPQNDASDCDNWNVRQDSLDNDSTGCSTDTLARSNSSNADLSGKKRRPSTNVGAPGTSAIDILALLASGLAERPSKHAKTEAAAALMKSMIDEEKKEGEEEGTSINREDLNGKLDVTTALKEEDTPQDEPLEQAQSSLSDAGKVGAMSIEGVLQ